MDNSGDIIFEPIPALTMNDIYKAAQTAMQQSMIYGSSQILVSPKTWAAMNNLYYGKFHIGHKIPRSMKKKFYKKYILGKYKISSKVFYKRALYFYEVNNHDALLSLQVALDELKTQTYKNDFDNLINED